MQTSAASIFFGASSPTPEKSSLNPSTASTSSSTLSQPAAQLHEGNGVVSVVPGIETLRAEEAANGYGSDGSHAAGAGDSKANGSLEGVAAAAAEAEAAAAAGGPHVPASPLPMPSQKSQSSLGTVVSCKP